VKALILRSAGTNCDRETAFAFERVGCPTEYRHVNELLAEPGLLARYRILALPGGFSYGDDIAGGRVLATELKARVLPDLQRFIADGGMVLGICNGFQVLVKTGLLPGPSGQTVTLTHNTSHRYEDSWVTLEVPTDRCAWTRQGETYFVPIAHAEGRFVAAEETLDALETNGQVVFRYRGRNPNGSKRDIAGICDESGRVLGLMPHPERHVEPWHHPFWTADGLAEEGDGLKLFRNAVSAAGG
jgi:phosphoribosylformylglycinamidine synthase I